MKILFIHRSVGAHLLRHGQLRKLLNRQGMQLDDYNNNNGKLIYNNGSQETNVITMQGNNTNPDNLAALFAGWPSVLDGYDVIMIKSCYPNSHIVDTVRLKAVMRKYTEIIENCDRHNKRLVIITTPPLRPMQTNQKESALAQNLADWLMAQQSEIVQVFDLHTLYAESAGKHKGMLKRAYRRLLPWDNHPTRRAHQMAAPLLVALLTDTN